MYSKEGETGVKRVGNEETREVAALGIATPNGPDRRDLHDMVDGFVGEEPHHG